MSPDTEPVPGVAATAAWSATAAAIEAGLFEVMGAWALEATGGEVTVALAAEARHAAWRAEQLAGLLAPLGDLDPADQLGRGRARIGDELARLSDIADETDRVATLTGEVLSALEDRYRARMVAASPVSEAPLRVVADRVAHDAARARATLAALEVAAIGSSPGTAAGLVTVLDAPADLAGATDR